VPIPPECKCAKGIVPSSESKQMPKFAIVIGANLMTRIAIIAVIIVSLDGLFGEALAQSRSSPSSEQQSSDNLRDQAPIGARQPRPRDLPESVLRNEGHVSRGQREFDKTLEICKGC
jgi:hypothetical protein